MLAGPACGTVVGVPLGLLIAQAWTGNVLTLFVTLLTGVATIALMWAWGLGGTVGALTVGRVVDRARRTSTITLVIVAALAAVLACLGLRPPTVVVAGCVFLWGLLGWAALTPQQHTLITVNPQDTATAVAASSSANYLGAAVGSALGAALVAVGVRGAHLAWWAAAVALLAVAVHLLRVQAVRTPRQS